MEEWKEYKLGELSDIQTGPFGSQLHQRDYVDEGTPCIMPTNIGNQLDILSEGIAKVKDEDVERLKKHCAKAGDIVYSRRGDIEKCAFITHREEGWLCGTGCLRIRIISEKVNPHFIAYQLSTKECKRWIVGNAVGTTMLNLNTGILKELPLSIPNKQQQDKIVSILKSLDDKIDVNHKINENLEQQAQALFKSWFVDFEPFKDQPFVESELGMIPQGWRVGTLGEIIKEIESGSRPKGGAETDGIPSIGAEKIERFGVYDYSGEKFINNDFYTNMKRGHVEDGDVLLYKDGAYTGKSSMALDGFPYCECAVNEHVFLLRTESSKSQFFLYYLISYPEIKTMIHTLASSKAAQPGLNQKELLGLDIIIPDEDTVKLFNNLVSPSMHQIATNSKQSRRLAELRDTLLPRLMSGELKVSDIRNI